MRHREIPVNPYPRSNRPKRQALCKFTGPLQKPSGEANPAEIEVSIRLESVHNGFSIGKSPFFPVRSRISIDFEWVCVTLSVKKSGI